MFCIKCGKQNADNARFCCGCGVVFEDIENQEQQSQAQTTYFNHNYQQPQSGNQFQNSQYNQNVPTQFYQSPYTQFGQPMMYQPQMYRQPIPAYGMSIASMVLGIISIVLFLVFYISLPCAIVGIVLGCISRSRAKEFGIKNTFSTAGIICSAVGIALVIIILIIAISASLIDTNFNYL